MKRSAEVTITQDDIDNGCQTDHNNCPTAITVFRLLRETYFPEGLPEDEDSAVEVSVSASYTALAVVKNGATVVHYQRAHHSTKLKEWIHNYDRPDLHPVHERGPNPYKQQVKPFTFVLEWQDTLADPSVI